ncbi:MAG: hypothetical protein H0T92_07910 [Pyrinomonadaceae bacterium]|nr:hypothetical protein [Pyrinomonadaceae bacterium]
MNMNADERGFTYLDVLVGMMILSVGIMALAAAVTGAVVRSRELEQQLIAKQHAASTLESIFSARDLETLGWDAVGNVGTNIVTGVARGIFLTGQQPIEPDPGADRIVGTADDTGSAVGGFQRQITITDINDPQRPSPPNPIMMREVRVIIFYQAGTIWRQEAVSTVAANY